MIYRLHPDAVIPSNTYLHLSDQSFAVKNSEASAPLVARPAPELSLEMHTETECPAQADIPTSFRHIRCFDDRETGGAVVPPRPSDHRDVRLFQAVVKDPEEPDAILRAIGGEQGLHCHHTAGAAITIQAGDEDPLQLPGQGQPGFPLAVELLVDEGHRAGPERSWPRQGAQKAAGVADRAVAGEDGGFRGRGASGIGRCGSGGV